MHSFKVYRVEWLTEVYYVDQNGQRSSSPPIYRAVWETREDALKDLERVAVPNEYVKSIYIPRWELFTAKKSSYVECGVSFSERLYSTF